VLEFRCATGDWAGALAAVESNRHSGLIDKATAQRQRAVLLTAQATVEEHDDRNRAAALASEAAKLAPRLVPAAALAGRLLAEAGQLRKASRIIEIAWEAHPHPDLAEVYTHLKPGDAARERLTRIRTLAEKTPGNIEAALAVARAAIDAREFGEARRALAPLAITPTRRVAMLMAELEEAEHGDVGRARQWMARAVRAGRDPAWIADGFVSDRWLPVSPVSGRLDAFEWKIPVAEIAAGGPIIEDEKPPIVAEASYDAPARAIEAPVADKAPVAQRATPRPAATKRVEAVIPLVHAPDDPGPDYERRSTPRPEPGGNSWRRRWFR
jgi:HemY protein